MNVFVSAWLGSGNRGDELIFAALLRKLRARGADVTAASLSPAETRRVHGISAIDHRRLGAVRTAIEHADLLLLGGGGLIQGSTSVWSPAYQLHRPWLAKRAGVAVAGIGLGVEPLGPLNARLARAVLRQHAGVTVRDERSARALEDMGIPNVDVAADLAWSLPPPQVAPADDLVVCLRPQPGGAPVLPGRWRKSQGDAQSYAVHAAKALDAIAGDTGLAVRMVSFEPRRDGPLHRAVAELMDRPATVEDASANVLEQVGRARVVVATRYHAIICAALGGRPVVALDYADKVRSLATELGPSCTRLPNRANELRALPELVSRGLDRGTSGGAAVERLRVREQANDRLLDRLLSPLP